jgi:hypothetical protein
MVALSLAPWRPQFRAVLVDYLWLFFYKPSSGAEVWASAAFPRKLRASADKVVAYRGRQVAFQH